MGIQTRRDFGGDAGDDEYEVGYGKPPKSGQFKPGMSGNPAGRRSRKKKPSLSLAQHVASELEATVTVKENGKPVKLSKMELIAKQLVNKCIAGSIREMAQFVNMLDKLKVVEIQQKKIDAEEDDRHPGFLSKEDEDAFLAIEAKYYQDPDDWVEDWIG